MFEFAFSMTGSPASRRSAFASGARDTLPMLIGAAPFGVIFGALVAASPLALWQGQLMSMLVFAGSSQFIALGLVAANSGMAVIMLATLIVNLRHLLYAASLLPQVARLSLLWRTGLGFLLTDETFAVVYSHYRRQSDLVEGHWYFLGSGVAMYLNWQLWTLIGMLFGASVPQLHTLGLDFAMIVTFIAIIVPQLHQRPQLLAALAAGATAWPTRHLPYQLGLLLAVTVGIVIGLAATRCRQRRQSGSGVAG